MSFLEGTAPVSNPRRLPLTRWTQSWSIAKVSYLFGRRSSSFTPVGRAASHQGVLFSSSLVARFLGGDRPMSCLSKEKISWYSRRRPCAFSACSVGQASKPDKSSLSRSKTCHSASVRVGCSLGFSVEMVSITRETWLAATILATGMPFLISNQS